MHVKHPLIKENSLESRQYQEAILTTAREKNTLCVLPTGLGKTNISILLAAETLLKNPDKKILILAPTRPLVDQHRRSFLKFLKIDEEDIALLTGVIKPELRKDVYKDKKVIFATPQTVKNDLEEKRLGLKDFSLLVLDEIHHAVGGYAYPYIATAFREQSNQRILGLTASPGGTSDKIKEICENCGIEAVEIKSEKDQDVEPYIKDKAIEWIEVSLPESFMKIRQLINNAYQDKIAKLRKMRYVRRRLVSKRELLALQGKLIQSIKKGSRSGFAGITLVSQAIKLEHALTLLETQSISMLENYFEKIRKEDSRASKSIVNNKDISGAMHLTHSMFKDNIRHPKISKLATAVHQEFARNSNSKIIIFCNFREMVKDIVTVLKNIEGSRPCFLIGQKEGLSQKEQIQIINEYELGIHNTLVTTSVGEEGLSLESADLAIFYEAVPSEIRQIQRRGRVGRTKLGRIIILVTRNSRDEAYRWSAYNKEKRMHKTLYGMKQQPSIQKALNKPFKK